MMLQKISLPENSGSAAHQRGQTMQQTSRGCRAGARRSRERCFRNYVNPYIEFRAHSSQEREHVLRQGIGLREHGNSRLL